MCQMLLQPMLLESPRWYAMYGNERMAEEQLVLLRDRDPTDEARYAVGIVTERRREGGVGGEVWMEGRRAGRGVGRASE